MDKRLNTYQPNNYEQTFKSIKCFNDLIKGITHWNGSGGQANKYKKLDENTVQVTHVYRYGTDNTPLVLTKDEFNNWLKETVV